MDLNQWISIVYYNWKYFWHMHIKYIVLFGIKMSLLAN